MKYIVTMNGKQYEVEVERMSAFHMLTREEIASGPGRGSSRSGSSGSEGSSGSGTGSEARTGSGTGSEARTGTRSGSGTRSSGRRRCSYLPDARHRPRR